MNSKAQYAFEYLMVLAFAMGLLLTVAMVYFIQTREVSEEKQEALIDIMANEIIATASNVYYSGSISKKTLRYSMPAMVNNIFVTGDNALVFNVTTEGASYEKVYYASVPIQGIFPETKQYTEQIAHILVYNKDNYVLLCTEEFGCK